MGGNRDRLVKGYKLSGIRQISFADLMYNMVTIVDNIRLHNLRFPMRVELKCSYQKN